MENPRFFRMENQKVPIVQLDGSRQLGFYDDGDQEIWFREEA